MVGGMKWQRGHKRGKRKMLMKVIKCAKLRYGIFVLYKQIMHF